MTNTTLRPGRFFLDCFDGSFAGFTDGDTWNGWARPHLAQKEMQRLADLLATEEDSDITLTWSDDLATWMCLDHNEGGETWPLDVSTAPDGTPVFDLSDLGWTWDETIESVFTDA